jgi:hypothetical protein
MLRLIRQRLEAGLEPKRVSFVFEPTTTSERARVLAGQLVPMERGAGALRADLLLAELRLDPTAYFRVRQAAMGRWLLRREAEASGLSPTRAAVEQELDTLRAAHGLTTREELDEWRMARGLTVEELDELLWDEAAATAMDVSLRGELGPLLLRQIRLSAEYDTLLARAHDKMTALEDAGLDQVGPDDLGLTSRELLAWYFGERLGQPVPRDLAEYARSLGFADGRELIDAVRREFCYLRLRGASGAISRGPA